MKYHPLAHAFVLISCLSFLLLSKSLPLKPLLPSWEAEMRLLSLLFLREFASVFVGWLRDCRFGACGLFRMASEKTLPQAGEENEGVSGAFPLLDLPELALECILGRLSPAGLCSMAGVCSSLRVRCQSNYLWERHMSEKWGRVMGQAAYREWQWFLASRRTFGALVGSNSNRVVAALCCTWPFSWLIPKIFAARKPRNSLPADSIMSWYLSLESGQFWFPAQVYNREHGHVGFMLSCYDAELSYECVTDTFHARYPPHDRRVMVTEEGIEWERVRAPPVDIPAQVLHVSDCLYDLRPGDHIEIQWRRNKEFPYGWWYGVVGHLDSCNGNEHLCRCQCSDTVMLQFNQYAPGSRWRQTIINRKDHREEGNEETGFYGGIRKLHCKEEIAKWRGLWPTGILE